MSEVFFTSDTHYGHKNIIKYCSRPFSSVKEMDQVLIDNWNKKVSKSDLVYHLGDFSFYKESETDSKILSQLNGQKILIKGNHDYSTKLKQVKGWQTVHKMHEVISDSKKRIILCHFPMSDWNLAFGGSWHFHGHSHSSRPYTGPHRLDMGVDAWYYQPVSIEEINEYTRMQDGS